MADGCLKQLRSVFRALAEFAERATQMEIKPIKTKTDYRAALKEIDSLMSAEPGTPQGERLDILVTLVEAYERKHFPMAATGSRPPCQGARSRGRCPARGLS